MSDTPAHPVPELRFLPPDPTTATTRRAAIRKPSPLGITPRSGAVQRVRGQDTESQEASSWKAECFNCYRTVTRYPYDIMVDWIHNHQCKAEGR